MVDFTIKKNDNSPAIAGILSDFNGVVNLTTATKVNFFMEKKKTGRRKVNGVASITDVNGGGVSYAWQTGDTNESGLFKAVFKVTFSSGQIATFPSDGYIEISIQRPITNFP